MAARRWLPLARLCSLSPPQWFALLLFIFFWWVLSFLPLRTAVVLLAGSIVVGLVVIYPLCGLGLVLASVPFGGLAQVAVGGLTITGTELAVAILTFSFLARLCAQSGEGLRVPWPFLPGTLFAGFVFFSATTAPNLDLGIKEGVKGLELLLGLVITASIVRERRALILMALCLVSVAAVEAAHGWYQFLGRLGPAGFLLAGEVLRAYGSFGQPNPYAGYLGLALPMVLGLLLCGHLTKRWLIPLLAVFVLLLGALVMSFSRGAWLAFAGAAAFMLVLWRPRLIPLMLALAAAGVAVLTLGVFEMLPTVVTARLMTFMQAFATIDIYHDVPTSQNWAVFERMVHWNAAWAMFQDRPLLGVGMGNFGVLFAQYAPPPWQNLTGHAHNYYLNLLAEGGLMGLATYGIMLTSIFAYLARSLRRSKMSGSAVSYGVALGVLGSFVALSIHNVFDNLFVHGMIAQVGLMLGLAGAAGEKL